MDTEALVPHEQEWELFHNSFSICSKKVRVCLDELSLPYEAHHVHLIETGRYETVSPAFLAINPKGTVPMLIHNGRRVYESHAQIAYAAKHADGSPELLPTEPGACALVESWIDRASIVGARPVGASDTAARAGACVAALTLPLFATMVRYIPYREIAKGLLTHPNKERPLLFLVLRLLGVARLPWLLPVMRVLRRARRDLDLHLDALETQLNSHGGSFITGDDFTLADVSWVVLLDRLHEADWQDHYLGADRRPALSAYWRRLCARPSVKRQVLEQRCEITRRGIADLRAIKRQRPALRHALEGGAH